MLTRNPLVHRESRTVRRCWRSNARRVQVRAADASPAGDSQTSRHFMALTALDLPSLQEHVEVVKFLHLDESWVFAAPFGTADRTPSRPSSHGSWARVHRPRPSPSRLDGDDHGMPASFEEESIKRPVAVSSTPVETLDGARSTFLSIHGSSADVNKLKDSRVIKAVVEVLPTCLVEPVQESSSNSLLSSSNSSSTLSPAEVAAHATWGVEAVKAMQNTLTGHPLTGQGVKVALLDTGLDRDYLQHPAFEGVTVTPRNFTSFNRNDTHDVRGHGTHCLGTILGRPVDGVQIGVAPGITDVIIGKVIPDRGSGDSSMLVEAIWWAWYEQGANIISISLAYDLPAKEAQLTEDGMDQQEASDEVMQIYEKHKSFYQKLFGVLELGGVLNRTPPLIIAACGNGNTADVKTHVQLPAAAEGVISVAAIKKTEQGYEAAPFSKLGAQVCAPGVGVFSAAAGGAASGVLLRLDSGTSMAAPHVAGVAALWWEHLRDEYGEGTAEAVRTSLLGGASKTGFAPGVPARELTRAVGRGLVQAPPV